MPLVIAHSAVVVVVLFCLAVHLSHGSMVNKMDSDDTALFPRYCQSLWESNSGHPDKEVVWTTEPADSAHLSQYLYTYMHIV